MRLVTIFSATNHLFFKFHISQIALSEDVSSSHPGGNYDLAQTLVPDCSSLNHFILIYEVLDLILNGSVASVDI